jgi:hypothetical protein
MANRNIEDTQHDFTTGEQTQQNLSRAAKKLVATIALKIYPMITLQLPTYVAYQSFHCRGRYRL